jgi:flavin reductase (DIM6/NTAB) family NADH-FMN oxidoreductase RutF
LIVDPSTLSAEENYKLLTGMIVPRPIAWVTTLGSAGQVNAAPFSAFTLVSNKPPMVAISIGRKLGELKDTARNITAQREFVVNIANQALLDPLHQSATEYPEDTSEVELLGLATSVSHRVRTPGLADAPVRMECTLHTTLELGDAKSLLVIGQVQLFEVRDGLLVNGKIDTRSLDPICRLGGPLYATLGEFITQPTLAVTRQI